MKPPPRFLKETQRWMLPVGRIPLGRGFLRELRRTWKSLRAIWNPNASHSAKAAARPPAVRRGLWTWLRRFCPPRRVALALLVPYVAGYLVLRWVQLLSFHYPAEALDPYMGIQNTNPTITTTLGGGRAKLGHIPVAEAPWWGLRPVDAGADDRIQWAARIYWPALFLESRFRRNVDPRTQPEPRDYYAISGPLPPHRCREALGKLLWNEVGLKVPYLKEASGAYNHHIFDSTWVMIRCWIPADTGCAVINNLSRGRGFEGGPAADYGWLRYEAEKAEGTLYVFWAPNQYEDGQERWRIVLREGGADLEYTNYWSDG